MRIEGKNLACFRDFELDLDQGPLKGTNLYAIVGKTGSGKSTLLDAVCLALFDTLPRVDGKGVDLGQGYHTGKTVSVVRRGASEAFAKCEFIGVDGVRYRSEWSVRSAGRGPLKDLKVEEPRLLELDASGKVVLTIKGVTEHRARIREVVGASAEEFRRSALLAQNEFAAFLQSPAKDRAVILEALTGSVEYTEIGKQVFKLATAAESSAEETGRRLRVWTGWTEEKGAAAHAARQAADQESTASDAAAEALAAEARVLAEQTGRSERLALAEQDVAAAETASTARAPDRERLSLADEAESGRGVWETHRKALSDLSAANAQHVQRAGDQAACVLKQGAASEEEQRTRALELGASLALSEGLPLVASARLADRALAEAERDHLAAAKTVSATGEAMQAQRVGLAKAEAQRDRARVDQAALQDWLDARPEVAATLKQGDPLPSLDLVIEANARLGVRMKARAAAELAHDKGCEQLDEALTGVINAERATTEALALASKLPPRPALASLLANHAQAVAVQGRSARAWTCHQELGERTVLLSRLAARLDEVAASLPVLDDALVAARDAAGKAEIEAEDERKFVTRLRSWHGLAELRLTLTEGEPCDLCGSADHPFAVPGAVSPLRDAEEVERNAAIEASRTQKAAGRAEAVLDGARAAHVGLREEVALVQATVESARTKLDAAEAERASDGPHRPAHDLDADAEAAEGAVRRATELIHKLDLAEAAVQHSRTEEAHARRVVEPLQLAERVAATHRASAQSECVAGLVDAEEKRRRAGAALGGWPDLPDLETDAGSARELVAATKAVFEAKSQTWQTGSAGLVVLNAAVGHEAARTGAAEGAHEAALALQLSAAMVERQERSTRSTMIGGQAADAVEAELRSSVQTAATAVTAAAGAARTLDEALRLAEVEMLAVSGLVATRCAAAGDATQELQRVLDLHGWTEESLMSRLLDHELREALRRSLEATLGRVRTGLARRDEAKAYLEALPVPADADGSTLPARQASARARVGAAQTAASDMRLAHLDSDRSKLEYDKLIVEHARLIGLAAPWRQLRELIGDAQGARFRALAQARVMDSLVELANEKLAIFAKRYTLCRMGEDARDALELQVLDTEGEGGARGTRSLSGGETFLVSLALALALGRLVSRTTHLRTLFIDEGFGSLDSDCILPVLAALATVASDDVQIGLISHVPEIADAVSARVEVRKQGGISRLAVMS
ncbi:MAG: hypothetical protein EXR71_19860 [Myxococcales bacterium]|nr:hypothetical protein [Myxococcales bacterium]